MKIEFPNGDTLVEDPHGSQLTTFSDQRWKVHVADFAPVSGSASEGRVDVVPGEFMCLRQRKQSHIYAELAGFHDSWPASRWLLPCLPV